MRNRILPLLLFFAIVLVIPSVSGQGDLMVMPKRLVFDGSERSQEINLANTGQDTAVYALSFINYKMTEDGAFEQVETPEQGQRFATDFLRYFPRRVILPPNEAQTIRVQLTRTGNLEEGEYRSHMYMRAVDKQTALGEENGNSSEGIAIQIKTIFGISIPIIIRQGNPELDIALSEIEMSVEGNDPVLHMKLNRSGNISAYGDITVEHIDTTGIVTQVGKIKGISVYTPNKAREFSMKIKKVDGIDLTAGKLKITYTSDRDVMLANYTYNL